MAVNKSITKGHGWAALLIAGNDTTNRKAAMGFVNDITDVHEVITSKFPLVMGVRKEHVVIVRPEKPGNAEKFKGANGQLDKAFKIIEEINSIQTLLIYFSGHHYDRKGFQLGSDEEFLSLEEFYTKVSSCLSGDDYDSPTFPLSSKRLVVFLDCYSAPLMKIPRFEEKSGLSLVQLNACRPNQTAYGDAENGSKFNLFFKQALTGRALGKQCYNNMEGTIKRCKECELPGDLVTLQDLNRYITYHLQPYETNYQTVMYYDNASDLDTKIGYAIQYSIGLRFTFKLGDDERRNNGIQQRMFTDMISLRTILSDKFIEVMQPGIKEEPPLETEVFRDILCIEIEHGPKYVHRDELDSLEKVMGAWYAKRDLIVSLRRLSDIRNGMVGIFLPTGSSVEPIKEYLDQNEYFQFTMRSPSPTRVQQRLASNLELQTREHDYETEALTYHQRMNRDIMPKKMAEMSTLQNTLTNQAKPFFQPEQQNMNVRPRYPKPAYPQSKIYGPQMIYGQFLGQQQSIMNPSTIQQQRMPNPQYNAGGMPFNQPGYIHQMRPQQTPVYYSHGYGNQPLFKGSQATSHRPHSTQGQPQQQYPKPKEKKHIVRIVDPNSGKDVTAEILKTTQSSTEVTGSSDSGSRSTSVGNAEEAQVQSVESNAIAAQFAALVAAKLYHHPDGESTPSQTPPPSQQQQELGPNSEEDTVYSIKLENLSKIIPVPEDNPRLAIFGSIMVDVEDELSKEKEYKKLHIIFPGAHGKQRNDFICFQIVKQDEED